MEALGLATTNYNYMHKFLDDPPTSKPTNSKSSPLDILQRVKTDERLDGLLSEQGSENILIISEQREAIILEYLNEWDFSDPKKRFEDSQYAAAAILVATNKTGDKNYDFFFMHILSTSHAVRILLPLIPTEFQIALVRQWWLLTLMVYVAQLRPDIKLEHVLGYDLKGKDWDWVDKKAIEGEHSLDAHYVKALRAMKEAATTWGDREQFYLKAAARFGEEFNDWGGFGVGPRQQ